MSMPHVLAALFLLTALVAAPPAYAQQQAPAADKPFAAGEPLKMTPNARTFGGFRFAESISYDAKRDLYVVPSAGMGQNVVQNDGYVSLINPDGTAHTLKWIGVTRNGLTLNHPLGSDIENDTLYLADGDTIRSFDMNTGAPKAAVQIQGMTGFINDVEVAKDGTIYATQTGTMDAATWRLYKVTPSGESSLLVSGAPLNRPNGVAFDPKGNVVVINLGTADILTFTPDGKLVSTEQTTHPGNDGLVVLPDGTKYVSSVMNGTLARIRPGQKADVIASGIPTPASMAYDSKRNRLLIPMNDWNAITFVELK
jgi:sugar lactone lactonase YvrE